MEKIFDLTGKVAAVTGSPAAKPKEQILGDKRANKERITK
jgi:hypothetical protein